MLSGSCLRHDALLTHFLGNENLSDGVVDLMGTRVVQVLTLEVELATVFLTHATGIVEGRRTAHVVAEQTAELTLEVLALHDGQVGFPQVFDRLVQNLGNVCPAERAVVAVLINLVTHICLLFVFDSLVISCKTGGKKERIARQLRPAIPSVFPCWKNGS